MTVMVVEMLRQPEMADNMSNDRRNSRKNLKFHHLYNVPPEKQEVMI